MPRKTKGAFRRVIGVDAAGRNIYGSTWYIRFTDLSGKRVLKSVPWAKSKREADSELERINKENARAREGGRMTTYRHDLTLHELLTDYIESSKDRLKGWKDMESRSKPLLRHLGAKRKVVTIKRAVVEDYKKARSNEPKERGKIKDPDTGELVPGKLKPASINRELALLRASFQWAVDNEIIPKGSTPKIQLFKEE
jgi:hypothetical protein